MLWAIVAIAHVALTMAATAKELNAPVFQRGMWQFQRTTEHLRNPDAIDTRIEEMIRCVDPNMAMRETFRSPDVGNCRSAKPQLIGNRYIFSNRCDYMGPVRTEITVESEEAYREVNELAVGPAPRKETIVARRLGACRSQD
jgi:hypothetical protein